MNPVTICIIISVLTFVLYLWNPYKSLGTTAILSAVAFFLTKCVEASVITSCFGNTTAVLIVCMFIIAAGFNKTQFVKTLAQSVNRIAKGSLTKVMAAYIAMAILLCSIIQSNLIPFCILYPLLDATVREMGIKPSKVMFPLGIACIITCITLPIGSGATSFAQLNAIIEANGSAAVMGSLDPMKARLPLLIVTYLYCVFVAPKLAPDNPAVEIQTMRNAAADKAMQQEAMPKFQETTALIIFFGVTILLLLSSTLKIASWVIAATGAALMVLTGVLNAKEAKEAFPLWVYLVFTCGLVMANALNLTGAGALVGELFAGIIGNSHSNVLFYIVFFMGPFILTQFILNQTAQNIFYPIAVQTALALGVNPIGAVICVQAGGFAAFFTPMATGTVPYMMGTGGYDIKQLFKMSVLPFLICGVVTVLWMSIAFPVF